MWVCEGGSGKEFFLGVHSREKFFDWKNFLKGKRNKEKSNARSRKEKLNVCLLCRNLRSYLKPIQDEENYRSEIEQILKGILDKKIYDT